MDAALAAFFQERHPGAEDRSTWSRPDWSPSELAFSIRCYLGRQLPPLEYVTSVRCLLLQGGQVMVVRDPRTLHLLPGGRRGEGETLEETLRREVLEETGWTVNEPLLLGVMHFRHLHPRPPAYRYPYPDFLQLVYLAEAAAFVPGARLADDYELEANFCPVAEAMALALSPGDRFYLEAALARREERITPAQATE